jgi:hypothetical protein
MGDRAPGSCRIWWRRWAAIPAQIQFYSENATVFGQPTQNNVGWRSLSMPPGSIMIAWHGTGPGRLGNALVFVHDFSLFLRAPEEANVGYEDLFNWIVNDIPEGRSGVTRISIPSRGRRSR